MPPIPCAHCGTNFMRRNTDLEAPKLCNTCEYRENLKNPKVEKKEKLMQFVIECPQKVYNEIEELCINNGKNFSQYFLELHVLHTTKECVVQNLQEEIIDEDKNNAKKAKKKL